MKLTHLNALRAFEAILRLGTFSAAADELGVTVAAIGQQIRALEDYFGLHLFDRLPSGARPTPEARAVADRLTDGFGRIEEALAELRGVRDGGQISLSLTYHNLDHWLAPRLTRFYAAHPDIEVLIDADDRLVDLLTENVDAAIRFSHAPGPEYDTLDLFHGCYFPICSPGFAETHGLTPDTRDLTGVPLFSLYDVMTDPEWADWPDWLDHFGIHSAGKVATRRQTGYVAAVSGAGLVLAPLNEAFNDLRDGRLVAPLGPRVVRAFSYKYRLVWPSIRRPHRAMRAFRDWIAAETVDFLTEASAVLGVQVT